MRINPMVKKDIKVQARSMRICWEIFAYEAIMAVVFFFAMFLFSQQMTYSSANIYSSIVGQRTARTDRQAESIRF